MQEYHIHVKKTRFKLIIFKKSNQTIYDVKKKNYRGHKFKKYQKHYKATCIVSIDART